MKRLIYTQPFDVVLRELIAQDRAVYDLAQANVFLHKHASDAPAITHALSGELIASSSGWVLLSVPNALVRGAFAALDESGVELPPQHNGILNAHISVMRPEEVEQIGGIDKITERGKHFHYTLGPVMEVTPDGWNEMSRVWFIKIKSTELQDLRKSYGLSPRPNNNEFDFHCTFAVRRKKVLQHNDVTKKSYIHPALTIGTALSRVINDQPEEKPHEIEDDSSHLDAIKKLPVDIAPKKNKPKIPLAKAAGINQNSIRAMFAQVLEKTSEEENGLLEKCLAQEDCRNEEARRGHNRGGEEAGTQSWLRGSSTKTATDSEETAFREICKYYSTSV